jgi:superfamily II DNA helicase RecQ
MSYCENKVDCRRRLVLAYFGENFDKEKCHGTCDNCEQSSIYRLVDTANHVKNLIHLVKAYKEQTLTINHCIDIYKGAKKAKIREGNDDNLEWYGLGSEFSKHDLERILHEMFFKNIVKEIYVTNKIGFSNGYMALGSDYRRYESGKVEVLLSFAMETTANRSSSKKRALENDSGPDNIDDIEIIDLEFNDRQAVLNFAHANDEIVPKSSKAYSRKLVESKKVSQSNQKSSLSRLPSKKLQDPSAVLIQIQNPKLSKTPSKKIQTTVDGALRENVTTKHESGIVGSSKSTATTGTRKVQTTFDIENLELAKNECFNELISLRNAVSAVLISFSL